MAAEGCQFGQEQIYLNMTRVSLAQLPGGDVERVCLWLSCPLKSMPHAPQTIVDSSISLFAATAKIGSQQWNAPQLSLTSEYFQRNIQTTVHKEKCTLFHREIQN